MPKRTRSTSPRTSAPSPLPLPTPGLQDRVRPSPRTAKPPGPTWKSTVTPATKPYPASPQSDIWDRADQRLSARLAAAAKGRRGRPSKLDRQIIADLVFLLEAGNYLKPAAAALGLHVDTVYDWLAKGRTEPPASALHRLFSDAVEAAIGKAEADAVMGMRAGGRDWRAQAKFLERRHPASWGQRLAITGADGAPPAGVTLYQAAAAGVRLPKEDDTD